MTWPPSCPSSILGASLSESDVAITTIVSWTSETSCVAGPLVAWGVVTRMDSAHNRYDTRHRRWRYYTRHFEKLETPLLSCHIESFTVLTQITGTNPAPSSASRRRVPLRSRSTPSGAFPCSVSAAVLVGQEPWAAEGPCSAPMLCLSPGALPASHYLLIHQRPKALSLSYGHVPLYNHLGTSSARLMGHANHHLNCRSRTWSVVPGVRVGHHAIAVINE